MTLHRTSLAVALAAALGLSACAKPLAAPEAVASVKSAVVAVGQTVQLDGSESADTNSPPLPVFYRWAFKSLPAGSKAQLNDPTIVNPSFLADVAGDYVVTLSVKSGTLTSKVTEVSVKAGPCGVNRPTASALKATPDKPNFGQAVLLEATVADADNDDGCKLSQALSYEWALVTLPAGSQARLNQRDAHTPSFVADKAGSYEVRLVVTDSTGLASAPLTSTIEVTSCGSAAPSVEQPSAQPAKPNIGQTVQLSAPASDADNELSCGAAQTLSYSWYFVSLPSGSQARLNDANVVSPSFVPDLAGSYVLRAKVSDGTGNVTLSQPVTVEASSCGGAHPVVGAVTSVPGQPNSGQTVQLAAEISDADSAEPCSLPQSFSYAWRLVGQPAGSRAALNNAGATNPSFGADLPGAYTTELVVTDQSGRASEPKSFTVTAGTCGSAAPTAKILTPAQGPVLGQPLTLDLEVRDADTEAPCGLGESFTYAWSFEKLPQGSQAAFQNAQLAGNWFTPDVAGEYVARVVVTDAAGHQSAPARLPVTATSCGGALPVAAIAASTTSPNVGQTVGLTASATDADNDTSCGQSQTFSYSWAFDSLPAGSRAQLNSTTAVTPSFTPDATGDYVVRLTATDSTGRTGTTVLKITATACGTAAPTVALAANPAAPGLLQPVLLSATVTDADNDSGCGLAQTFGYSWSFEQLPAGSKALLNAPSASQPGFVPDVAGDYVVRLVATDSTGRKGESTLKVTASACGGARPVATASASDLAPNVGQSVLLTASATDADNDPECGQSQTFGYAWAFDSLPAGSRAQLNSTSAVSPSFTPDVAGEYVVRLVVTDSTGRQSAAVTRTITANVCGSNAPTAAVTATPASSAVGVPVLLSTVADDADNALDGCQARNPGPALQTLSYGWTVLAAPAGSRVQLSSLTAKSPSFVPDLPGSYTFRLVVTDSTGRQSAPVDTTVAVNACGTNRPQVSDVSSSVPSPAAGQALTLGATFTDADNEASCEALLGSPQSFTYGWTLVRAPAGSRAQVQRSSALLAGFTPDVAGEYQLEFRVTDSTQLSATRTLTLTAGSCGQTAPAAAPALDTTVGRAGVNGLVVLRSNASDADNAAPCSAGQSLSYKWALVEQPAGSRASFGSSEVKDASFVPDVAGTYVAQLVVTDSTGLKSTAATVSVPVSACGGAAPVAHISGPLPLSPLVNSWVQFDALGSTPSTDADNGTGCELGQTLSFRWELFAAPAGSTATLQPSTTVRNPSLKPDVAGTYLVRLRVTDSTGLTSDVVTASVLAN